MNYPQVHGYGFHIRGGGDAMNQQLLLQFNSNQSRCLSLQYNYCNTNGRRSVLLPLSADTRHHHNYPTPLLSSSIIHAASGSAADYNEQLLDTDTSKKKKKKNKRRIAGVDQDELMDPTLLADPDSCFCEFKGVHIHHKIQDPDPQQITNPSMLQKLGFPMILLHGFGASVYSWTRAMKPLAQLLGSKVVAFDRPAFGLTSRPRVFPFDNSSSSLMNPYSMAFSVLATSHFIDLLSSEKAVLVGHSAGSLVAVNSYFESPERVAALILVAPAILVPRAVQNVVEGNQLGRNYENDEDRSKSYIPGKPFIQLSEFLSKFMKYVVQAIMRMVKGMGDMLNSLYNKMLSAILRSAFAVILVRVVIDKFGAAAVRNAWYDPKQVSEHVLQGYTKPLRATCWDRALLEFIAATLIDTESETKPPLAKRLNNILCPVLIVTGDRDRIVPSWNAERLSRTIPGSCLQVIKHCGHLPHEEKVEEFVSTVEQFLQSVLGNSEGQCLQAAT
ncbi:Abhydrolase_6 domain-containing protein [Cephalotus follicularis]|uniref:Abhydrolase_6 domain-containing protein n=1 Tax=Cephalotus follicularis TaxID=3775 RepID=A0A1Q3CZJ5_CEPFO|nr:Abhydrolase_6 domain-containing protein [Cephalotus follicularis]